MNMEKVKVTKAQADAIECLCVSKWMDVRKHLNGTPWESKEYRPLNYLGEDEFIRALYIGYEVEPEFQVGDCVALDNGKTVEIISEKKFTFYVGWIANGSMYKEHVSKDRVKRHATKQEKWWAKHGRDVWELKKGDVIYSRISNSMTPCSVKRVDNRGTIHFTDGSWLEEVYLRKYWKVAYFAEDRKDIKQEETK